VVGKLTIKLVPVAPRKHYMDFVYYSLSRKLSLIRTLVYVHLYFNRMQNNLSVLWCLIQVCWSVFTLVYNKHFCLSSPVHGWRSENVPLLPLVIALC